MIDAKNTQKAAFQHIEKRTKFLNLLFKGISKGVRQISFIKETFFEKRILTKSIEAVINATKIKSQEASSGIEGKFSSPKPPSPEPMLGAKMFWPGTPETVPSGFTVGETPFLNWSFKGINWPFSAKYSPLSGLK